MTRFVQIIEYTTSRPDELRSAGEEWRSSRSGEPGGPDRVTVLRDRDREGHYYTVAEFESYDTAMANSGRDDTSQFASRLAALCDGPPVFHNLDVAENWTPDAG